MLAIEVEYLLGRVFASDFSDPDGSEWPPHPDRLFSAMVAAHHDTLGTNQERDALQWIQRQEPPEVSAGDAGNAMRVVNFVPSNYAGKSGTTHPDQRGKQPRVFPAQGPSSNVVHFVWRNVEPDEATRNALSQLTARVPSLGRACSLVRVRLSDCPDAASHVPDDRGAKVLRVATDGRLEELESLFQLGQRPTPGQQKRYRKLGDPGVEVVPSVFGEMVVIRKISGVSLPIEAALTLTSATRNAMLKVAGDNGFLCDLLSGHGAHPHCAFVALPFAGYERADGRLMGAAILIPRGASPGDRRKVLRTAAALEEINLREALGLWKVELTGFDEPPQTTLRSVTWSKPSRVWSSVTPILLDRFPKKNLGAEEILKDACARMGLPEPIEISHQPYSKLAGVPPVPSFRLMRSAEDRPRWGVHATLRFETPVQGPLVLGAGRYFGIGLMKPLGEQRHEH